MMTDADSSGSGDGYNENIAMSKQRGLEFEAGRMRKILAPLIERGL